MKTFFIGEVLMRLEAPDQLRFIQTEQFFSRYTGAELNSGVIMHCLGAKDLFLVSAFPKNALGDAASNAASHWGIHTDFCIRRPGRLGLFFLEQGFGSRPSAVIYDRAGSVFADSRYEDYDFEHLFSPGDWVYVSGTMPALATDKPAFLEKLFARAREQGCTICFDLNYRAALWSWERAAETFRSLLKYVDVLLGNEGLVEAMFRIPAEKVCAEFSLKYAALTRRQELEAEVNTCSAVLHAANGASAASRPFPSKMLDRIGGGDAFSGAVLYALQNRMPLQEAVDFAVAAQVLKQTVRGDFGLVTRDEIQNLLTQKSVSVRR